MITGFKSRGLKRYFERGDASKLNPQHVEKIRLILTVLQRARRPQDMNFYRSDLHLLTGDRKGTWSVAVHKNWKIIFKMDENGNAYDVNYEDYH